MLTGLPLHKMRLCTITHSLVETSVSPSIMKDIYVAFPTSAAVFCFKVSPIIAMNCAHAISLLYVGLIFNPFLFMRIISDLN